MGIAFFDLDRTLIDVNSGSLWLKHEWREGTVGMWPIVQGVWWLTRYALGDDQLDHAIEAAASVYEGVSEDEMHSRVGTWFDAHVAQRIRPGAKPAMQAHRDQGDLIVLASSTSQFAAGAAERAWGFDGIVCTTLEVASGVLTGRLAHSGFGRHKHTRCVEWARARDVDPASCAFYTDSYSDLPLLEVVGHPRIVDPDRRLAREAATRGWPVLDWGTAST